MEKKMQSSSCSSFDYSVMFSSSSCIYCASYLKGNSAAVMFCHVSVLIVPTRERDK